MPGKCFFNPVWLEESDWKLWLRPSEKDKYRAKCIYCRSDFYVGHSGIAAVKTHIKSKRHGDLVTGKQTLLSFQPISPQAQASTSTVQQECTLSTPSTYLAQQSSSGLAIPTPLASHSLPTSSRPQLVEKFILKDDVLKAEIVWALNTVMTHNSYRSESSSSSLFPIMFPDSVIAKQFKMQRDKLAYVITFGLGPYFQKDLVDTIKTCNFFAVSFDESLNKVSQRSQMDIVIRYWDDSKNEVATRYVTSAFLTSGTADNLQKHFTNTLIELGLPLSNIVQIALDGPNVNLKFLRDIREYLKHDCEPEQPEIFDTGTCSLHIVQGAYKTAHNKTGWAIHEFLRAIFYLFNDFPSRRGEYTLLTGKSTFPLKFCAIRWVENADVLTRAISILPALKLYANTKSPPNSKNFGIMKSALSDSLLMAKLEFLLSVANMLERFLKMFQSNNPMLPYMYNELFTLMKEIANRFVKKEVIDGIKTGKALIKLDLKKDGVLKTAPQIDIGFGAKKALVGVKELHALTFRNDCRKYLCTLFEKLVKKCPLLFNIVKGASCLSPNVMKSETLRESRINVALQEFVSKNHMTAAVADGVKQDYLRFCEMPTVQKELKTFVPKKDRLDSFLMKQLEESKIENCHLEKFFKQILILFHGNAEVERGFSINKHCLVENLNENSLIAQRSVYSAVSAVGEIKDVLITKSMILYVKNASARRCDALKSKKEMQEKEKETSSNLKKKIKILEENRKRVMSEKLEELDNLDKEIKKLKTKI